jgi:hypothetical protein
VALAAVLGRVTFSLIKDSTKMGGLFSKPKIPEPQPPAPMPDENSPGVLEARRQQLNAIMSRSGRRSTILSDSTREKSPGNSFDSYDRENLG